MKSNKLTFIFLLSINLCINVRGGNKELIYIENKGQWHTNVLYKTTIDQGAIFLEHAKISFNLREKPHIHGHSQQIDDRDKNIKGFAYNIEFLNANPNAIIETIDIVPEYFNYFIGDTNTWRGNCKGYQTLIYKNIYPNIDLNISSNAFNPKYTFIIHPNGNIEDIKLKYNGIDSIHLAENGDLFYKTPFGIVSDLKPISFLLKTSHLIPSPLNI